MTDKPDKRGGPRPNSGRRPIDPALKRKPFSCTLAPETDEWIRMLWESWDMPGGEGKSLGEIIDAIVIVHKLHRDGWKMPGGDVARSKLLAKADLGGPKA